MKLKLISKVNKTATRGNFTLPKGTYYIGDPGYIFDDKFYNNVLLKHAQEAIKNKKSSYVIPNSGNPLAFISSTLDGDGRYPSNHGFWFSVDSGQIACVNSTSMGLRTEDQLKYYFNRNAIYQTEFDNNFECIGVDRYSENRFFRQEDKGIITMGDLKIQTDSRAWEDEEDYRNYKFPDDSRF